MADVNLFSQSTKVMMASLSDPAHKGLKSYEHCTAAIWLNIMAGLFDINSNNPNDRYTFRHEYSHSNNCRTDLMISRLNTTVFNINYDTVDYTNEIRATLHKSGFGTPFLAMEFKNPEADQQDWAEGIAQLKQYFVFDNKRLGLATYSDNDKKVFAGYDAAKVALLGYKRWGIVAEGCRCRIFEVCFKEKDFRKNQFSWEYFTDYTLAPITFTPFGGVETDIFDLRVPGHRVVFATVITQIKANAPQD